MQLTDGLQVYKTDTAFYTWAVHLERHAERILALLQQHGNSPPPSALEEARNFLVDIEKWKAGCLQQRMGNAAQNPDRKIWIAIQEALNSPSDIDTLLAVMQLKGFGSSVDDVTGQRRAKVATSVLRFLWPATWGVVDWRVAAMLGFLSKNDWDIDKSISEAKHRRADDFREVFDIIDEQGADEYNRQYREISRKYQSTLPRAADVDMAVFGLSLVAWPMR